VATTHPRGLYRHVLLSGGLVAGYSDIVEAIFMLSYLARLLHETGAVCSLLRSFC